MSRYPFFLLLLASCLSPSKTDQLSEGPLDPNQVYNLKGEKLPPKTLKPSTQKKYERTLTKSFFAFQSHQDSVELIIWYGRRLAYLGKYHEAIDTYTEGIQKFPASYRLLRHRGHRYLTTRQTEKAIEDLRLAASLSKNARNAVEPDGLPNALNIPLGNDKFNIWYHLGLGYYLAGRYEEAQDAYVTCMDFSNNNDLRVATTYWHYLTLQKLKKHDEAAALIAPFSTDITLIENEAYLHLIKLFKGQADEVVLLTKAVGEYGDHDPTLSYGIGSYYLHQGKNKKAMKLFKKVMEAPSWDAFGYLAAEAELYAKAGS